MNAIKLLDQQHNEVTALFDRVQSTEDVAEHKRLFEKIADALAAHSAIEEKIFYPACKAKQTHDILFEAVEEHLALKRLIADLIDLPPTSDNYAAKLKVLGEQVEHHVTEERRDLFPEARKLFNKDQLEALGQQMQAMFEELQAAGSPRYVVPAETTKAAPLR
jgi:hemerythrin superfamily protein